jgi:hypothetical protein
MTSCRGYMPPEYRDSGLVSNKFDVFSLGIIIIKTVAGNMGYFRYSEMSHKDFIEFVRKKSLFIYTMNTYRSFHIEVYLFLHAFAAFLG